MAAVGVPNGHDGLPGPQDPGGPAAARLPPEVALRRVDAVVGLGLFATAALPPGRLLWEEPPVACVQDWDSLDVPACSHCLRSLSPPDALPLPGWLQALVPQCWPIDIGEMCQCPGCAAVYCSGACRAEARHQYHALECLLGPECGRLAEWAHRALPATLADCLRLTCRLVLRLTLQCLEQAVTPEAALGHLSQLQPSPCADFGEEHTAGVGPHLEAQWDRLAALLLPWPSPLRRACHRLYTPAGFLALARRVRNGSIAVAPLPAHLAFVRRLTAAGEGPPERPDVLRRLAQDPSTLELLQAARRLQPRGTALYGLLPLFNHSCRPNVATTVGHTNRLQVMMRHPASPGDDLLISYAGVDQHPDRTHRRMLLQLNWGFVCRCPRCSGLETPDIVGHAMSNDKVQRRVAAAEGERRHELQSAQATVERLRAEVERMKREVQALHRERSSLPDGDG